jgi:hypothetical protein
LSLTSAQLGVWVGQQLNPTSPRYNAAESIEITGPLEREVFERALRQTVAEAEVLHARFVRERDEVVQVLAPQAWELADVGPDTAPGWIERDLRRVVDLERGPLFAHALIPLGAQRHLWYHRCHHIALDGYGFSLIAQRVAQRYSELIHGQSSSPGFGHLADVVADDLAYRDSEQRKVDRAFWHQYLEGAPPPVTVGADAPLSSGWTMRHSGVLPLEELRAVGVAARASWVEALLAVVAQDLARRAEVSEVTLGVPVMGRLGTVAARTPAMIMNVVPLRVRPAGSLVEVANAIGADMRASAPHRRYRFEWLRRELRPGGLYGPLVNAMPFDYHLDFAGSVGLATNLSTGAEFVADLAVQAHARSDGSPLAVDIDAPPGRHEPEALAAYLTDLLELLAREGVAA